MTGAASFLEILEILDILRNGCLGGLLNELMLDPLFDLL